MRHLSSDGGRRLRSRWIPTATHGAALLLGVLVWIALFGDRSSGLPRSAEAARHQASRVAVDQATAWTDAALTRMRGKETAKEREETGPATLEEFLEEDRKDRKKWWQTRDEELDQVIARAQKMRGPSDPAATIRAAVRNQPNQMDELVLFQHWLDTDPDAALAELERNWLLNEREYIAALLQRKFGTDWMLGKIADAATSYRLRDTLARELGFQAAQGRGLAGLLKFYHSIPDPQLKNQLAWNFSWEWPLGDPREAARVLGDGAPKELQDLLLEQWANPQYGPSEWELKWMRDDYGDPVTVAGLLAALPEEQRGSEIVEARQAIDRRLGAQGAGMTDPSPAYLGGVAGLLLKEGRLDEFFETFAKIEDRSEQGRLAEELGNALAEEPPGEQVLAQVLRLPRQFQKQAVYNLMGRRQSCAMEFPEVREAHQHWIERVATEGFVEAAAVAVHELFDDDEAARRGAEWADWIAGFPPDDSWRPITKAVFRAWKGHDREEMIRQICALPDGATRQTLAIEAADATIGGLAQQYDEDDQAIYDRLSGLCTEPEARKRFDKRIKPWSEPSGEDMDPFEPSVDPFAEDHDPFANENDPFADEEE